MVSSENKRLLRTVELSLVKNLVEEAADEELARIDLCRLASHVHRCSIVATM